MVFYTVKITLLFQVVVVRRAGTVLMEPRSTPPTGVYMCRIPDSNGDLETLYIGVGLGKLLLIY